VRGEVLEEGRERRGVRGGAGEEGSVFQTNSNGFVTGQNSQQDWKLIDNVPNML